jgi:hypothetical protein
MKTIRHNTYETNSSSSHSITIVRGAEPVNAINGLILYPAKIREYVQSQTDRGTYGSSSTWVLTASTLELKASLLVHQLTSFLDDNYNEEWCKTLLLKVYDVIKEECGYEEICTDGFYASYDLGGRYGTDTEYPSDFPPLDFLGRSLSDKPTVDLDGLRHYIREYICNPTITIIDTSKEY